MVFQLGWAISNALSSQLVLVALQGSCLVYSLKSIAFLNVCFVLIA